jgi:glycosyltransferase involved in cell wall biosynthesis
LKKRGICPLLLVAGEFWEDREACLAQIERLGLAEQVRITARYIPNEEVSRFFAAADVQVAPYTDGTQSGAAEVGLGYGLPLIASDRVAAGIHPDHSERLLEVPGGDAAALAEAIAHFLSHRSRYPLLPPYGPDEWRRLVRAIELSAGGAAG